MKQNAVIKNRKTKAVEKAILITKQLSIDFPEPFSVQVTAFVPKANVKAPMPKLAVTINLADDMIRPVSGSVKDLQDFFLGIAQFLAENEVKLEEAIRAEGAAWLKLQEAYLAARNAQMFGHKLQAV